MPRSHTLPRTVAAALAITALAAPTALARPIDPRSSDTKDAAEFTGGTQDLRSPDAQDAASQRRQDLRRLAAGGMQTSSLAGTTSDPDFAAAYAQERYYSTSVKPAPVPVQASTSGGDTDDGAPWAIFALSLAGAALAGAGGASLTRVRARRTRVTA
jgi:hypothetical protein